MDSVSFEIHYRDDGAAEVRLGGELDLCTGPDVASQLERLLETPPVNTVVIDLDGLSYCDCSGLNVFANAQRDAARLGKQIVLVRASAMLRRVFESVQFGQVVEVADGWAPADAGSTSTRHHQESRGPDGDGGDP